LGKNGQDVTGISHFFCLELVSKLLSAAIGCKACGSALSAKRVLDVLQHASEPFPPPALTTDFSLDFAKKSVLKPVLGVCRRIPSSARERAIFSSGKDGEAGDVGSIVDAAGYSQAEEGPLEARSSSPTGS